MGNALIIGLLVGALTAVIVGVLSENDLAAAVLGITAGIIALVGQLQRKP